MKLSIGSRIVAAVTIAGYDPARSVPLDPRLSREHVPLKKPGPKPKPKPQPFWLPGAS